MPLLEIISCKIKKGSSFQEFKIKKKDYGELILYDIFFEDKFLFTISQDGKVLLSNWEDAKKDPVSVDENILNEINAFILNRQSLSL